MSDLTINDIVPDYKEKIYVQEYPPLKMIEGVKIWEIKNQIGEEGDFSELMRLNNGELESFPGFTVAQINRTKIMPGSMKAWHLHFKQDEIWYVTPSSQLLVGLWDLREKSETKKVTMRLSLGGGLSKMVYIPRGVAHGMANLSSKKAELLYFVSQKFDLQDPDERRLPWDGAGASFWEAKKD